MKLFDRKTHQPVEVPDDQLHDALASGAVGAPVGTPIPVRMDGRVGAVPIENLGRAIAGGAEVVPQSVYDKAELQAQYGDAGHAAEALGAEALDTATLGLSNAAIGTIGGQGVRESIRKSQQAHPLATGVGTALGIAAPVAADVLSGGALTPEVAAAVGEKVVARGAEGLAARGVARAGEGVVARGAEAGAAGAAGEIGAGEALARVEPAAAVRAPAPAVEGVLEDAPRGLRGVGPEMQGEVVPNGPGLPAPAPGELPGGPPTNILPSGALARTPIEGMLEPPLTKLPGIAQEIEAEIQRIPRALKAPRPIRALPEHIASAVHDVPEFADVAGTPHTPFEAPQAPPTPEVAAASAARAQRIEEAAKVVEEAREAGADAERAAAQAAGKGVVRQVIETSLFGPTRLVNSAGDAVENAVRGIIGREAETALGRIAQDAVAKAARGAVEGGIYNVGNEVGHQFLQDDPDLSGERLASAWFNGALLGGGFGLGVGAIGRGTQEALSRVVGNEGVAKYLTDKAGEHMWHAAGPTKKMSAEAEKYAGGVAKVGNLIRQDAEQLLGRTPRTREEMAQLAELMQKKHNGELDAVLSRLDDVVTAKDSPSLGDVLRHIDSVEKDLKSRAVATGPIEAFKERIIDALGARDKLTGEIDRNARMTFKQLRDFRATSDEYSKFNSTADNATRDGFRQIRRKLENQIEETAQPHLNEAGGSLLKDYKAAKAGYQAGKLLEKASASGVSAEKSNLFTSLSDKLFGLGAATVLGHTTGPVGAFVGEKAAELASKYVRKNFDFVVSDVLAKLANVAKGAHVLDAAQVTNERVQRRMEQGLGAVKKGLDGKPLPERPPTGGPQSFEERRDMLLRIAAQHEAVVEHLQQVTSPLDKAAPNVAGALYSASLRTVVYLMDALPKPPKPSPNSLTPHLDMKDWQPSDPDKAAFNRKFDMAVHPEAALALVAAGALTPQHVEALDATHPKMKADMSAKLRKELDMRTKPVPAGMRSSIRLFLGVPQVDPSLARMMQANYAPPQKAQSGLKKPIKLPDNTSLQ